ncbi:hypothetical protein GY45DRAFT_1320238 [Cubamyces sp. BRFM 1775]|nr:hypothetical protein GY45DRAFT_1320238 [Cubamyces sp. BRFM 1775]
MARTLGALRGFVYCSTAWVLQRAHACICLHTKHKLVQQSCPSTARSRGNGLLIRIWVSPSPSQDYRRRAT